MHSVKVIRIDFLKNIYSGEFKFILIYVVLWPSNTADFVMD
jgi:hypothetical protein